MILRCKIGSLSSHYVNLRESPYVQGVGVDPDGYPPTLDTVPEVGKSVSWVELGNGPLHTGRVYDISGEDEDRIFFIERL